MPLIRYRQLLFGVEGLALLRLLFDEDESRSEERVQELAGLVADKDGELLTLGIDFEEHDIRKGYAAWSEVYDDMPNPALDTDAPIVRAIVADMPAGRALDVACGTGRQSAVLADLGWDVTGVDATPEMLDRARARVPGATFLSGTFDNLPVEDAAFDLVISSLALTHVTDLGPPTAEMARAVRPGGRVVLSDIHPIAVLTGAQAAGFRRADGRSGFVRNHLHWHSAYIRAFVDAGLRVCACYEPPLDELEKVHIAARVIPEATEQAMGGIPFILVWDLERA